MALHVAGEVHGAALPGAAQDLGDGLLQTFMSVGDSQSHAVQAASHKASQELAPEGLGLGLADVEGDDLAAPRLVDAVGDHQGLVAHATGLAYTLHLGVEPEVGVATFERTPPEDVDLLVKHPAEAAHRGATHGLDTQLRHEALDLARTDAVDVGLGHNSDQGLLGPAARLQEAREVAARSQARDGELEAAHAGVPGAFPVAVAIA